MKTTSFKVLLLVISFLFIFACSKQTEEVEQVVLFVRAGAESDALQKISKVYNEKFKKDVLVNVVGRDSYTASMSTKLLAGTSDIDIFLVPSTMIAELASSGVLEKLDSYVGEIEDDFLVQNKYKGNIYALPIDISTMLLFYRKDLIKKPPETWEDYFNIAKNFSQKTNPNSPTKYGAAIGMLAPEDLSKRFFCMTWSFGGEIQKNDGLVFDSQGSIAAVKYYLQFFDSGVTTPEYLSWGVVQIFEALNKGELAMSAPEWNAIYPYFQAGDSPFKDNIGIALIPGIKNNDGEIVRKTFQHSWTLVINKNSKRKDDAYDFIKFVVSKEGAKYYSLNSVGTPARKSILSDPEIVKIRPEFKYILDSLSFATSEPDLINYDEVINVINNALTKIMTKEMSPEKALKEATEKVRNL